MYVDPKKNNEVRKLSIPDKVVPEAEESEQLTEQQQQMQILGENFKEVEIMDSEYDRRKLEEESAGPPGDEPMGQENHEQLENHIDKATESQMSKELVVEDDQYDQGATISTMRQETKRNITMVRTGPMVDIHKVLNNQTNNKQNQITNNSNNNDYSKQSSTNNTKWKR